MFGHYSSSAERKVGTGLNGANEIYANMNIAGSVRLSYAKQQKFKEAEAETWNIQTIFAQNFNSNIARRATGTDLQ